MKTFKNYLKEIDEGFYQIDEGFLGKAAKLAIPAALGAGAMFAGNQAFKSPSQSPSIVKKLEMPAKTATSPDAGKYLQDEPEDDYVPPAEVPETKEKSPKVEIENDISSPNKYKNYLMSMGIVSKDLGDSFGISRHKFVNPNIAKKSAYLDAKSNMKKGIHTLYGHKVFYGKTDDGRVTATIVYSLVPLPGTYPECTKV